ALKIFENNAKIVVNSRLLTRFSKLPLLLTPLTYLRVGDEVNEDSKCIDVSHELLEMAFR
ncbi:MAG: hypothetical protein KAR12_10070, partial [Methylococcales bacterium]|nr:hypothetical protein [Methylococcales bacterium]